MKELSSLLASINFLVVAIISLRQIVQFSNDEICTKKGAFKSYETIEQARAAKIKPVE
jgi:hypothetical protein